MQVMTASPDGDRVPVPVRQSNIWANKYLGEWFLERGQIE
jgi:hypothetical protein